jgi:hypothetical protein
MTINQDYPTLDGISPSWSDVIVRIAPDAAPILDVKDIKGINTSLSLELGEQRGASGGRVMARTTGQEKCEASMDLYYSAFRNKFLRGMKNQAPKRGNTRALRFVHFGVNYLYTPFGEDDIFEVRLYGCCYTGRDINGSEGTDAQIVNVKLSVLRIVDMVDGEEVSLL